MYELTFVAFMCQDLYVWIYLRCSISKIIKWKDSFLANKIRVIAQAMYRRLKTIFVVACILSLEMVVRSVHIDAFQPDIEYFPFVWCWNFQRMQTKTAATITEQFTVHMNAKAKRDIFKVFSFIYVL